MVCSPPPGPHPQLHTEPAPARDRTRQRAGFHEVPPALAARDPRHEPPRPGRAAVCGRTVARVRACGRCLGGVCPAGSGGGLPEALAGRPLPIGRGRLGQAVVACSRSGRATQTGCLHSVPGDPRHLHAPSGPAVAHDGDPGQRLARGTGPWGRSRRARRAPVARGDVLLGPARRNRPPPGRGAGGPVGPGRTGDRDG